MVSVSKQIAISQAIKTRLKFNVGTNTNIDIFDKLKHESNFTIVFIPLDDQIDGFSHKHKNHYIIVINSNISQNRKNFTCAHELYHLLFEYDINDNYVKNNKSEEMANVFASYFLIPEDALYLYLASHNILSKNKISLSEIVRIEDYFQVSRHAILIRLYDEGLINLSEFEQYNQNVMSSVKKYGGKIENHLDHYNCEKITIGEYNKLAKTLLDKNKISLGKYEEYMIDAFNYKMIFGDSEDS